MQHDTLQIFLAQQQPGPEEAAVWGDGTSPLRIVSYLSSWPPPEPYVTSIRSLVFRGDQLLTMTNEHATHIVPGGRREPDETWEQTLRREILEESGWSIVTPIQLGFMHFHHLAPRQADYPYPYPDFVQVIFMAEADSHYPSAMLADDYEHTAVFRPIEDVSNIQLSEAECMYLSAAIEYRARMR